MSRQVRKAALALSILSLAVLAADSPFTGTWKLDAGRSKLGDSGIGSNATVQYEITGKMLKVTVQATDAQGQPNNFTYEGSLDGKPAKVTGVPGVDEVTLHQTNAHSIHATGMKSGKQVWEDRRSVSPDGKTMTLQRTGTNDQGKKYSATLFFEKQ